MDAFKKLFDTFVGIIVDAVLGHERFTQVEKDVKTLHDSGAALLALNFDNEDFRTKMEDFTRAQIDDWYSNMDGALWTESEIDERFDIRVTDTGFVTQDDVANLVRSLTDEVIQEAITEHERDKEHFSYRHEFEDAVKEIVEPEVKDKIEELMDERNGDVGRFMRDMRDAIEKMEKSHNDPGVQRSQLKALLLAAAGMVDSIDQVKGGV
jgi:hypothetical protein